MDKLGLIKECISRGHEILKQVNSLTEIPQNPYGRRGSFGLPTHNYDKDLTHDIGIAIEKWKNYTSGVLGTIFGEKSDQKENFLRGFNGPSIQGFNYKEEYRLDVEGGLNVLEPLLELLGINEPTVNAPHDTDKQPIVFISHSSDDKKFVEVLVNMLVNMGMDSKNLFCSSFAAFGVKLGDDFLNKINSIFTNRPVLVLFVHSPRYYNSHICLNEMGAAWVLKAECYSILTKDMEFQKMDAAINSRNIAVKVDTEDAYIRLNEMKDAIIKFLGREPLDNSKWEWSRNAFLEKVNSINYEDGQEKIG